MGNLPWADSHNRARFEAVELSDCIPYCKNRLKIDVEPEILQGLVDYGILPVFHEGGRRWLLPRDLELLSHVLALSKADEAMRLGATLFTTGSLSRIRLSRTDYVEMVAPGTAIDAAFFPAIRHLAKATERFPSHIGNRLDRTYFQPTRISSTSIEVLRTAQDQVERAKSIRESRAGEFAHSAYYMGSKRDLSSFLLECLCDAIPVDDGVIIDLMCGSGVVAGTFARRWRTIASDAQMFCRLLAEVQGGGFTQARASELLARILPGARIHAEELADMMSGFVSWEDQIFHTDLTPELRSEYERYIRAFPLYGAGAYSETWRTNELVQERRADPRMRPYCLFTTYFANVFLGLRQCIEIDSLRCAIEMSPDAQARRWGLGALIATVSKLATTYAGHFAQPLVKDWGNAPLTDLAEIIEKRTYSVFHEFSIRLLNLATESEEVPHTIEAIEGPWSSALRNVESKLRGQKVAVYLDPPYRREEYSRYYHVLDTLALYSYPTVTGSGRAPDKRHGERFRSEFFTRNGSRKVSNLVRVIGEILARGWTCAWSYSSVADAGVLDVLRELHATVHFDVSSYAAPHQHNAQGGRKPKKVAEYLLIFTPN